MKKLLLAVICAAFAFVSGCATAPDKISASYVSPAQYSGMDCDQIRMEMYRVSGRVRVLAGQQRRKHKNDEVAMGVGLVLFWPALFFLIGGDKREELAELKGEYDALNAEAIEKKCAVVEEVQRARTKPPS